MTTFAQDLDSGNFFGNLESNSQWLQLDDGLDFDRQAFEGAQFKANNYLLLNYNLGKFTAGVQFESYLPDAILGYAPEYDGGNGIAHYYLNYKDETLDITGGNFYDQFGSGLLLRSWEDRQLGINNSIRGVRVNWSASDNLNLTGLYGQQRNGFEYSEGVIQGLDANFELSNALNIESVDLRFGASYVSRFQPQSLENPEAPENVNAVGARLDFVKGNVYGGIEANTKSKDVLFNEGILVSNKTYDGTSMQINLGYAQKGLGINSTFRRLENWSFYADREAQGNVYNQQILNYVPALSKQQDYLLTNIYVYNAQPGLFIDDVEQRSGEVGTQTDIYYSVKKGTKLGGKYGMKIAANFSYWSGLESEYNVQNRFYEAKFIGSGPRLFRDFNVEVKKKWSKRVNSVFTLQDVVVDKGVSLGGPVGTQGDIHATVAVAEATIKMQKSQSLRVVGQHLWAKKDRQNWMALVAEYNFNSRFSMYVYDNWNYREFGYDGEEKDIHYYNIGASYTKGRVRVAGNYGRQRGGLICVGGVCRFVPESNGLSATINVAF